MRVTTVDVTRPSFGDPKVWTTEDRAVAYGLSPGLDRWRHESDELMLRVGARFARVELRRMAAFVQGGWAVSADTHVAGGREYRKLSLTTSLDRMVNRRPAGLVGDA